MGFKARKTKKLYPSTVAIKLVNDYLEDCGGYNNGFVMAEQEQKLVESIMKELLKAWKLGRFGRN